MRTTGIASLLIAGASLSGCAPNATQPDHHAKLIEEVSSQRKEPPRPTPGVPVQLTSGQAATVVEGVKRSLKDPWSAQFGDMAAVRDKDGSTIVCGMVNAKNSYGGYGGYKKFRGVIVVGTGKSGKTKEAFVLLSIGGSLDESAVTEKMCRDDGIIIGSKAQISVARA